MRRGLGKHGESALLQDLSLLPPAKGDKDTVSVAKKDAVGGAVPYNVVSIRVYPTKRLGGSRKRGAPSESGLLTMVVVVMLLIITLTRIMMRKRRIKWRW